MKAGKQASKRERKNKRDTEIRREIYREQCGDGAEVHFDAAHLCTF